MKLTSIISQRKSQHWPSWDLVYEWEDIFARTLNLSILDEKPPLKHRINIILSRLLSFKDKSFIFEMGPFHNNRYDNNQKVIPCIIDFFLKDDILPYFIEVYKKNPIVLISSKEVLDHLIQKEVDKHINIGHLPLSISDKYKIDGNTKFEKKYDLILMGRQNPVLEEYLKTYIKDHKDFIYVYRILKNDEFMYYSSNGECLGNINTRDKYMELMRMGKCGLYATPGIDGGEKRTNGFNQVTPRFLELIACGCHVIARYKKNPDTDFYEIEKFSNNIESYQEFEKALDYARSNEVNMSFYSNYLAKHYTSERVKQLQDLINDL